MRLRFSSDADRDALFDIWLAAVRATHRFLSDADLTFFARLVREDYLPAQRFLVAVDADDRPVGFMGASGDTIESLFVHPEQHRRGVGRALLADVLASGRPLRVDVNEQNENARRFYDALGFVVERRSPTDGSGRPYPLLHLIREARAV